MRLFPQNPSCELFVGQVPATKSLRVNSSRDKLQGLVPSCMLTIISWLLFSFLSFLHRNTSYITSRKVTMYLGLLFCRPCVMCVFHSGIEMKKEKNELISEFCYFREKE